MTPTPARLTTAATLAVVATAAVLVTAALMTWLRPHDPEFVAVGTPEAPAEFGEQFRVNGLWGGVVEGTILGVTEYPPGKAGRCFMVVGVVRWADGEVDGHLNRPMFDVALSSEGWVTRENNGHCGIRAIQSDVLVLGAYNDIFFAGEAAGHYELFMKTIWREAREDPQNVIVSGDLMLGGELDLDPSMSVYEFRVDRTLDAEGVAQ